MGIPTPRASARWVLPNVWSWAEGVQELGEPSPNPVSEVCEVCGGPGRRGNKVRTVLQSYKVWKEREEWGKVGKALQNPPTQCPGEGSRAGCPAEGDTPVGSRAPGMCPPLPTSASLEGALGSSLSLSLQFPGTKRKYLQPSALSIYVFAKPLSPPGL